MTHGASGYSNGCRCDDCRMGHRERAREHKRRASGYYARSAHETPCERCGTTFEVVHGGPAERRFCSRKCQLASRSLTSGERKRRAMERKAKRAEVGSASTATWVCGTCHECGEGFTRRGIASPYCSKRCSSREARRRRRALESGSTVSRTSRFQIHERDGWACHICGDPVDRTAVHPDPAAPVLDHVIALASGGAHHEDNLKTAHSYCNSVKRDLPLESVA